MKILKCLSISFLSLSILYLFALPANAENLNELFQTVVFLHGQGIKHHKIKGVDHEIWIKKEYEDKPKPFKEPLSGTGFFVRKNTKIFIVTAEHVAKNLKYDIKATVHGPGDKPLTYDISELSGHKNNNP